jgi:hypothetical protein
VDGLFNSSEEGGRGMAYLGRLGYQYKYILLEAD